MVPGDLRYTKDHEWIRVEGDEAVVGITQFAADQLGDIVFVELPDAGRSLEQHATFGVVESVKAVSDLFAPVAGEVAAANGDLAGAPEAVNSDPYGSGWMIRVRLADPSQVDGLLDAAAYEQLVAEG
jgi:glycine cleavage system H protein